eukprot:6491545-Amphidinium_carterae.1
MVAGPFPSAAEAASYIGCLESELVIGALAARPETGKTRTIFDASITQVNDRIRAHIPQVTEAPGVADLRHALALEHACGHTITATKMDISAAHRRIRIQRSDWKYMVATCNNAFYVNQVGTFGVASAQYQWGRLAALLNRLCYHLTNGSYNLVYVDDFLLLHQSANADRDRLSVLILMLILGVPLSWKKLQFGQLLEWIGIEINLREWTVRPSPDKLAHITSFLDLIAQGSSIQVKPLRRVMGVLAWYTGIIPHLKVFLGPLYAWLHALQGSGRPSKHLRAIARAFMSALHMPVSKPCEFYQQSQGEGATDAGADSTSATIGGWWASTPGMPKHKVIWFAEPITSQLQPWAWATGNPQHKVAALELYANLVLLHMVRDELDGCHATWRIRSTTDNQANAYGLHRWSLKGWPNYLILMEIALLAQQHHIYPAVSHTSRDNNTWADQLTHLEFQGFDTALRWRPPRPLPSFLPDLWPTSLKSAWPRPNKVEPRG